MEKNNKKNTKKRKVVNKEAIIFQQDQSSILHLIFAFLKKYLFAFFLLFVFLIILGLVFFIYVQFRTVTLPHRIQHHTFPKVVTQQIIQYASPSATFRVPILLYHYVEYVKDKKDKLREALNVNPSIFDTQMQTIQNAGYTFMTASDLADVLDGKTHLPQKPIMITFDDGHWDLYTDVLPILKKYHIKATAYIITGFLNGSDFLSNTQLQGVISSGLVEIGDHTIHHIPLAGKVSSVVQNEVMQSKETLQNEFHISVVSFSYPFGSFDQVAANIVKNNGFRTAVSTLPGIQQNLQNRFFLYRIRPGYRTGQVLLDYLNQNSFTPW